MKKILLIILLFISSFAKGQTFVDTTIDGYNAVIYRPAEYYVNGNEDSALHCFVFSYGAGETAATYTTMRTIGGPIPYLLNGGKDSVVISGITKKFIAIGLRIPTAYPTSGQPLAKLNAIRVAFKIKKKNLHVGGFSAGGYAYKIMATEDDYDNVAPYGPFTYADAFKSLIDVQGVIPDDNSDWYNKVKNYARNNVGGGKFAGWWGSGDGDRQIPRLVDSMNAVTPGCAYVHMTGDAHSWTAVHRVYGYPEGTSPQTWLLNGSTQTVYEWAIRNGDTTAGTPPVNNSPLAVAGTDQTIQLPVTAITLTGSGTDIDGTIISYQWTKISGGSATITNPDNPTTTVTGLVEGVYSFRITVTDNESATGYDEVQVTVNPLCNAAAPVTYTLTRTGSSPNYEIYMTNASGQPWKGGDTLLIPAGAYSTIEIDSFGGDPCRDIIIKNLGGQVTVNNAMRFKKDVHYVKIMGIDTAGVPVSKNGKRYGIQTKSMGNDRVSHFTVKWIEVGPNPDGVGILIKQNPDSTNPATLYPNYTNTKIVIDGIYLHNVEGEGMYLGNTAPNADPYYGYKIPQQLDSVTVMNCQVDSTGWDGIQVSNARNGALIYNNTVTNFGLLDADAQRAGIILGGNTIGKVYNNVVANGTGNGIQIFGYGVIECYGNTITNVGNTISHINGEESIFAKGAMITVNTNPNTIFRIYNNQFNYPKARGVIRYNNENSTVDSARTFSNKICFATYPGASWQSNYFLYTGSMNIENTGNVLFCIGRKSRINNRVGRKVKF